MSEVLDRYYRLANVMRNIYDTLVFTGWETNWLDEPRSLQASHNTVTVTASYDSKTEALFVTLHQEPPTYSTVIAVGGNQILQNFLDNLFNVDDYLQALIVEHYL